MGENAKSRPLKRAALFGLCEQLLTRFAGRFSSRFARRFHFRFFDGRFGLRFGVRHSGLHKRPGGFQPPYNNYTV